MENKRFKLFKEIISELSKEKALEDLILIGSWALYYYRIYFNQSTQVPAVRTTDLDFMIPSGHKIKTEKNLHKLLERLNCKPLFNYSNGLVKYEHPDLEIEFLTPMLGRGRDKPYEIKKLHINAQGLRFLSFLQNYTIKIKDKDVEVTVPEPAAFVMHKFIISQRRKKESKAKRDIAAAKILGEYLIDINSQKEKMENIFKDIPKQWQKKVIKGVKGNSEKLYNFFITLPK